MSKNITPIFTGLLLVLMTACGTSEKKTPQAEDSTSSQLEEVQKIEEEVKLSEILDGQWKTEGTEASSAQWREFDSSSKEFYSWGVGEPRVSKPSGTYEVIGDTVLQFFWTEYNETVKYGFDSVSSSYLDMWSYGVSAGNFIYEKKDYEQNHLKDISKDTIAVEGKVIKAFDSGMAFTVGLHIDIGTDTLLTYYFTEKYSESSLRNKHVSLRYYNSIEYNYANPESLTEEFEITGVYKILSYGGDLPGAYSVTDKNGRTVVFDAFLSEEDDKLEGTEVTERYTERYIINIASIEVIEPIMNTLIFGDWNVVTSDATPIGHQQIKIRPGGKEGVYIDFGGQGENYVAADIYSNTLSGTNVSGTWKLELVADDPTTFVYSDDGQGGHFEPIKNQKYRKQESDNRNLLIGKWQGVEDPTLFLEFTDKEMMMEWRGSKEPYVLSNIYMSEKLKELYSHTSTGKVVYISTLENGGSARGFEILKLDENNLSYTAYSRPENFKRVK